ncbi:MAG: hypothetical protein ACFB2W_27330 [Leptolyngbyaceae cyanobacterium]
MNSVNIHAIPVSCQIGDLKVVTAHSTQPHSETILQSDVPFSIQVSLAFVGTNAIALLALTPAIQVDFYAKPLQAGATADLGMITMTTAPPQMAYTPILHLDTPDASGLITAAVYRLGALVRIGAVEQPALLCGVIEELIVQIC